MGLAPQFASKEYPNFVYGAFGEETNSALFSFSGRWGSISETHFHSVLNYNRWFDGSKSNWLSRDPIGIIGDLNYYRYVKNRTTKSVDPSGLLILPSMDPDNPENRAAAERRQREIEAENRRLAELWKQKQEREKLEKEKQDANFRVQQCRENTYIKCWLKSFFTPDATGGAASVATTGACTMCYDTLLPEACAVCLAGLTWRYYQGADRRKNCKAEADASCPSCGGK